MDKTKLQSKNALDSSSSCKMITNIFEKKPNSNSTPCMMVEVETTGENKKESSGVTLEHSLLTPTSSSEFGSSKMKERKEIEMGEGHMNIEVEGVVKEKEKDQPVEHRFFLRKRKKVSYNMKAEYDNDDSDYEESPKHRGKKNKKKSKTSQQPKRAVKRLKEYSNPVECREFQLEGLLSWKAVDPNGNEPECAESKYYELSDILNANLETYVDNLQAILVNPPWSHKMPKFGINEFTKIKFPLTKMKEGLIFIWTEKEYIGDIVEYFEKNGIKYVENVVWVRLDPEKKEEKSSTSDMFSLNNIFKEEKYMYFTQAHMTLLMFRKFLPSKKRYLELRHQRTGDAVFDYENLAFPFYRPNLFAYKLIETLLPKALYKKGESLKMLEIFSRPNHRRKGWTHILHKK